MTLQKVHRVLLHIDKTENGITHFETTYILPINIIKWYFLINLARL